MADRTTKGRSLEVGLISHFGDEASHERLITIGKGLDSPEERNNLVEEDNNNRRRRRRMQNQKEKEKENMSVDYHNVAEKDHYLIVYGDLVVTHILSRLPVRSLMRCKWVCKGWKSIIERDSHFINLYHSLSQARPVLLITPDPNWGWNCIFGQPCFFSADLQYDDDGDNVIGANLRTLRLSDTPCRVVEQLGPVRGLVCLVDSFFAVQIYNISTGQVITPWIKSAVVMNRKHEGSPRCQFGWDPSTGKYKVVYVWLSRALETCKAEVLTVGDTSWRIIDDVPPCQIQPGRSVYANGSVYWVTHIGKLLNFGVSKDYSESLLAFDIGAEKFRMIPIPKSTFLGYDYSPPSRQLLEIDGFPTVVLRSLCFRNSPVKMWKFHDYNKENGTEEGDWTEVEVKLPRGIPAAYTFYHPIAGKDQIILEAYSSPDVYNEFTRNAKFACFYSYNLIKKTVSKFEIQGISSVPDDCRTHCSTLVESLLHVAES